MRFGFRELIFVLLLLGMPVAAYFFVFEPRNTQIEAAVAEVRQKQAKLQKLEEATRTIDDLGEEIDRLTEAVTLFQAKLPEQKEVEVILKEVWELAAANQLTPRSVRTDRIVPADQYAELPIRMVIEGNFDGFYQFLMSIEQMQRITRLPTMTIKKVAQQEDGGMQANLVLSIFFEGEKSGAAARGRGGRS